VKLLLEKGANIETKCKYGWTPLLYAVYRGHKAMVNLLADKGADIKVKDIYGGTLLTYAVNNGHEAIVKLLQFVESFQYSA
jgi:ankyrin repeat protein